jgi:hypothetical protein
MTSVDAVTTPMRCSIIAAKTRQQFASAGWVGVHSRVMVERLEDLIRRYERWNRDQKLTLGGSQRVEPFGVCLCVWAAILQMHNPTNGLGEIW